MEVLKLQEDQQSADKNGIAVNGKAKKTKEPTEAPAVAEFLLALAHSHPSEAKGSDAPTISTPTATVATNMHQKLGGRIISRPPGAPIHPRPLPEYLTLTRIPPLLFAEKLLRHENVPLEHYFPDQFDVELANYEPSDHDIICGRGRGNFSHIGNQKLLDIIRERQDDYLKSNKRGKGALGKQILLEILMNGGRFIKLGDKLKDKDQQIWRVLSHKDVNTKIMHCIRDQINFNRRQNMSRGGSNDGRGTKNPLDASVFPPSKRMKGQPKKLSSYLKMKYQHGDSQENKSDKGLATKSEAERALGHASLFATDIQNIQTPRLPGGEASRNLAGAMLARSHAEKAEAQSAEAAAAARLEAAAAEGEEMALLAQKHAFAQAMGGGMQPGLHGLIAKKEAELAALRAAMMGDAGMSHPSMMQYSALMPQLGPSPLELKQSMILARAELAAAGLRDPLADHIRLASMMNQDALMADHMRQAAYQRAGMVAAHPLASLLGGMPAPAPLGAGLLSEGETPATVKSE